MNNIQSTSKKLAQYAMFVAVILILGLTPVGYIYLPMAAITTVHIPVIIGGQFFGVKGGALLGFFFGLTSLLKCFTAPDAVAMIMLGTDTGFGLYNLFLIVCVLFIPRILVGVFTALSFRLVDKFDKTSVFSLGISALVGSLTNTVLFLGGLALLASEQAAGAFGVGTDGLFAAIIGIVSLNGLLEAAAAVIVSVAVGKVLLVYLGKRKKAAQ